MTSSPASAVRMASDDDLMVLPVLEAASDTAFEAIGITGLPPAGTVDELRRAAAVMVIGEPPVGFARLEVVDGQAHLEQLAVHPDHARRGLGTALVEAAVEWARGRGFASMTLTTFRDVAWNGPFYERLGFAVVDTDDAPELASHRQHEQAVGLDAKGARTAMRRPL